MPICKQCREEVDELISVKVAGRRKRLCEDCGEDCGEDCADEAREQDEIAEESESVVQQMMGFKGRR